MIGPFCLLLPCCCFWCCFFSRLTSFRVFWNGASPPPRRDLPSGAELALDIWDWDELLAPVLLAYLGITLCCSPLTDAALGEPPPPLCIPPNTDLLALQLSLQHLMELLCIVAPPLPRPLPLKPLCPLGPESPLMQVLWCDWTDSGWNYSELLLL